MKKTIYFTFLSLLFLNALTNKAFAQKIPGHVKEPISLSKYLSSVIKGNLQYIASQFNVSISEAELNAAKIIPDPEISLIYANNEEKRLQMGQSVETSLSYPINLGNKRKAGIELARSQLELSKLMLEAFYQNLMADAALSYYACLKNEKKYQLQQDILDQLTRLARADSIRFSTGEATALDALQSSFEARSQQTNILQSLSELHNSYISLLVLQGKDLSDTINNPSDDFPSGQRDLSLDGLIEHALEKRADLLVALTNTQVSEKNLKLLKANRAFEFSLETGYSYNSIVKNEIAPAPAYNGLSAGIAFPIKFSSLNRGSVRAADLAVKQSEIAYRDIELQIRSEVICAYNNYITQNKKIEQYNMGLINDAEKILNGRLYAYQNGESDLLEVLNAQRTYTDLQMNYLDALFDYTSALIELERASGKWDLIIIK
jgi:cobalt-zinc-cadmium efflux system outer membrane protein